jgi:hypothetical protein
MSRADLARWIEEYERAWRSAGTGALARLFAAGATYRAAPFDEPVVGLDAIARFWEAERVGPDEVFAMTSEVVAVEGATGVARIEVRYGDPVAQIYRDLWVVTLDDAGRATTFEEWPFAPEQPRVAPAR